MKSNSKSDKDKIDVEELIKDFKVTNLDNFASYLKEVWRDLSQRSDDSSKGINKITFSKYFELPGIICDRLFAVFDNNKNDYLDLLEFTEGMNTLFSEGFLNLSKFIFKFYDFDNDGKISKDDIRVVISYIPLNSEQYSNLKLKYEKAEFKDRVESQNELHELLETSFGKETIIDYKQFLNIIQNISSEIFLYTLIYIMDKKPFSKGALSEFKASKTKNAVGSINTIKSPDINSKILIASPSLNSKFTSSVTISNSPTMSKREINPLPGMGNNPESKNMLMKLAGKETNNKEAANTLSKLAGKFPVGNTTTTTDDTKKINLQRKERQNLKDLETAKDLKKLTTGEDLPITPAVKISIKDSEDKKEDDYDSDDEDAKDIKFEGFLYKITQSKKLKKLWFKLIYKDLYYFKNQEEPAHKGMHNLSGVFIKEDSAITYDGKKLFCFSVVYPKKTRYYYVENEDEYQQWMKYIRKATGYYNLNDIYDIKEKLGNGKFGLVRLGFHKTTGRKVAVKIMNKKDMNTQDLELVKTEIEILKVCQHPYIIQLYDVFENIDFIYIIMEYCSGGDLFSYIEKRGFKLPEPKAAEIIHKLSAAIFYIHSYGIAHRDLKPENILMTDNTEGADVRLLDFGLSKIIGPTEFCNEPFGTISYVAPEVLLEKPYNKSVDLWTIGIITYLLLCGCLPFDDENSEKEIARQTINDAVPFPSSLWKDASKESKQFIESLLQKDPNKRLNIKEILEHPWINKFSKSKLPEMRKKTNESTGSLFKIYSTTEEHKQK